MSKRHWRERLMRDTQFFFRRRGDEMRAPPQPLTHRPQIWDSLRISNTQYPQIVTLSSVSDTDQKSKRSFESSFFLCLLPLIAPTSNLNLQCCWVVKGYITMFSEGRMKHLHFPRWRCELFLIALFTKPSCPSLVPPALPLSEMFPASDFIITKTC